MRAFLLLVLSSALAPALALDSNVNELETATRLYCAGRTDAALKSVDRVLQKSPDDVASHYLRANCLVKLNRLAEAFHEYALVDHMAPRSGLAQHARAAAKRIEAVQLANAASKSTSSTRNLPPGTIELIRQQADHARRRALDDGEAQADAEIKKAESQARAEIERVERMAQSGRNRDVAPVSAAELELLRGRAHASAAQLKQIGDAKASWKEEEAQKKAENLKQQAEALEQQLLNDKTYRSQTIKLNPVGTNLYTRNYASARPPLKALQAQSRALSEPDSLATRADLASQDTVGKRIPALVSKGNSAGKTITKVRGEVLPRPEEHHKW